MKNTIKKCFLFFIFLTAAIQIHAQELTDLNYYGVYSENIDSNMIKIASDLYYTQLQEIQQFIVKDMRSFQTSTTNFQDNVFSDEGTFFYVEINKDETEQWYTIMHLVNRQENLNKEKKYSYDSYYKILMETKDNIKKYIINLTEDQIAESENNFDNFTSSYNFTSTESLSGTWKGEENIDKIVILKGGRGFVVFKNGATMNVTIAFDDTPEKNILVTQKGKSNASFYPEIPRQTALSLALSAEPIQWTLSAKDQKTLTGTKKTFINSDGDYLQGIIGIEWKKMD